MFRFFLVFSGFLVLILGEILDFRKNSAPFQIPPSMASQSENEVSAPEFISVPTANCHSAALTELPDGRLFCTWFGGTQEGAMDVGIYGALHTSEGWSKPEELISRSMAQKELGRNIRKIGNPVIYFQDGKLHLFFVSVFLGGWSGSCINHALLDENGTLIPGSVRRLRLSPFLNLSNLVRCPALPLKNGEIGLPIYHEFARKFSRLVHLSSKGKVLRTFPVSRPPAIQPCIVPLSPNEAVAVMRNHENGNIPAAQTKNGGRTWHSIPNLPIFNPDSSVAMLHLADGRFLLVGNPKEGRGTLNLWVSEGPTLEKWVLVESLENAEKGEFSYPFMIQGKNGVIHLIYTWKRHAIVHQVINPADVTMVATQTGQKFCQTGQKNSQNPVYVTLGSSENAKSRNRIAD